MEDEVKYEGLTQDVSNPNVVDAVHSVALGESADYRSLAKVKALVDRAFNDAAAGKLNPKVVMSVLKIDLKIIFLKY